MDRQEKKRYLRSYQATLEYIERQRLEYEKTLTEATKIVPELSGMPSSNVKDDKILKYTIELTEISKRIEKAKRKIARIDKSFKDLTYADAFIIRNIDIYHVPIATFAREERIEEDLLRRKRNRIIDKLNL